MTTKAPNPRLRPHPGRHSRPAAAPALRRLARLLCVADGAWALAVVDDLPTQQTALRWLRAELVPVPVVELRLSPTCADPLALLRQLPPRYPAPVVSFTGVGAALPALAGYLDLQRESLARLPHRLLFWVSEGEHRALALQAPNFVSRLSGVFELEPARV
jgi:hypothetical protein